MFLTLMFLEHFQQKDGPHSLSISKIIGPERRAYLNVKMVLL